MAPSGCYTGLRYNAFGKGRKNQGHEGRVFVLGGLEDLDSDYRLRPVKSWLITQHRGLAGEMPVCSELDGNEVS